jgi:hypothetical protein
MLMTFDADTNNLDDLLVGTLDAGVELASVPEDEAAADDLDFSSRPRLDLHPSPRERPSTQDECRAAPNGDVCASQLPSTVELGHRSPISVFTIDLIDYDTVTRNEPILDRFLEESGHLDPALLRPPTEIVKSNDNHDLDLDTGSVKGDAESFCSPWFRRG